MCINQMCSVFIDKGYAKKANSHQMSTVPPKKHHALAMLIHLSNFLYPLIGKVRCAPMGFEVDDNIDTK